MPPPLDRSRVRQHLDDFDFRSLFIPELGWDHGGTDTEVTVKDNTYSLQAVAQKRGFVAYLYHAQPGAGFPDHPTRQQIERKLAKEVREHLIIFCPHDRSAQYWFWVKRGPGRAERPRTHIHYSGHSGEPLIQKLEQIVFTLEEEADITIVDPSSRVRAAFDVEKVTRRFYDRFKKEHQAFLSFIEGINNIADREWYASLMLNRMMFIYFIQKRGFLDGNPDYLRHRLHTVRQQHGGGRFAGFYRLFLLKLFHEGLGKPEADRDQELTALLGQVPYLNGGLFDVHDLEHDHPDIDIPDEAFEKIFAFFDAYQWHLDDRPLRNDNEINPDVLGYIFEKYINQKQMGAYYTKEDITGYISRNTIIPFLFDRAKKACPIAFQPGGGVWRLLQEDPDGYFYEAVRHGITYDIYNSKKLNYVQELPPDIAAGLDNVAQRGGWNEPAPKEYTLPTETWREHVARRRRYEEIYAKLEAGEVTSINDLITYNLNIEKFALDVIANSEGPELVRAFWKAIVDVSVLDPTCGSGAFLFAALNILEPLYSACLEAMDGLLDDLKRSRRKHSPRKLSDFKQVKKEVDNHASKDYFILKSIVINNLYGVDIMEEAVEICKLRLFLKLVAQLETYDQIEPLPDIDFNVRAGNTLVGFASLEDVKRAIMGDWIKEQALPDIEERAELADKAFRRFRAMQTDHGMDAADFADAKLTLRERLDALRVELDGYLAGEYGVREEDEEGYAQWRASHQPFHWFVEFYGIMQGGGFDVIVGNPPYVELSTVRKLYRPLNFSTEACGNLYALCTERAFDLQHCNARFGFIVQQPITSTIRMAKCRDVISDHSSGVWSSTYDDRPSKLFNGMHHARLAIILAKRTSNMSSETVHYVTRYNKWFRIEREYVFHRLAFVAASKDMLQGIFPKISSAAEDGIICKLNQCKGRFESWLSRAVSSYRLFYKITGVGSWFTITPRPPRFFRGDQESSSTREKEMFFPSNQARDRALCILNSSLFFWFYQARTNSRDFNPSDYKSFPVSETLENEDMSQLACKLRNRLDESTTMIQASHRITGTISYEQFTPRIAKPIIDEIDCVLAQHYGFTDEELDFIINYDIKYRMGR
ncbi:MAG: SAM-dependent methyltransferase [Caldilineaceae bacterium SB0670_bin_27]|uniref:site-specific DNA-methyltransferase (adenine-specific) n=1 Tax=Caldilineaceae bacterium SB0664_bin_27 TaxID=2605260 RepID=A0A6B0YW43_9CHLR|nr:SAM-dependent methyltransferase [Caldilineaceae bacterium SB0664_bin_27]MYJ80036.1 SAM-dependent methyltransferase [Caldilineaceae bacterium SB0670_bin_27]